MGLCREVGDSWMVALAQNNLGNANREIGDYDTARRNYSESLEGYSRFEDQWALAFLLEDIAILAVLVGQPLLGFELLGAAESLRTATGSPRGPVYRGREIRNVVGSRPLTSSIVPLLDFRSA